MPTDFAGVFSSFFETYGSLLLFAAVIVGLILLTIIPQRKQQKKVDDMLSSLKPGDYVRTVGGFFGNIESIEGDVIILKAGPDKKRIAIARNAVSVTSENKDVENTLSDISK